MGENVKYANRILEEVHEAAREMFALGTIDAAEMKLYDVGCLPTPVVPNFTAAKIKALRERYEMTQAKLAFILNTSLSTVRQWEIGAKRPSGPSSKLLDLLDRKGIQGLI
jgi:putative transcriptional regulator